MSKNIDPSQQAIRDTVKEFAEKEIYPVSDQLDRMPEPRKFPTDLYKKMGAAGFIGFNIPKDLGGQGKTRLEYITLVEELSYHDAAVGLLCAVGEMATSPIVLFGSDQQKKKYVPDCASGKKIPAFVLTEPSAGADIASLKTDAKEDGGQFVVSGEKMIVMHGDVAEIGVLFCKLGGKSELSALIVDDTAQDGWQARTLKDKLGMRAATSGGVVLKDVRVPKENLLGETGKGYEYAVATLDRARAVVAAQAVGIGQRALDESVEYAKKRQAFGQPIAKLQAIQWMIADMATRLEAARGLVYQAARMQDAGDDMSMEASMAKLYATEVASFCVDRAMQIHAGYGYIGEFSPIEKLYRDQRALELDEGTFEVQRLVIADKVIGK